MESEFINKKSNFVVCIGDKYPFNHPLVYLKINLTLGVITCPYCRKTFLLD